jgi:hypothetical protein
MPSTKRKFAHKELQEQARARAAQVVESQLQELRDQRDAEQVVESRLQQLRQQYQMQPPLSQRRLEPMRPPPRDAQIPLLPSEEEEYDEISDFRTTSSGSGISAPSFIVEQRYNMPYEKQLSSMEKHQQDRIKAEEINKVELRRSDSFQGNERASPTRALMPAHKLSELRIKEHPYQEKARYKSKYHEREYGWGKTKRKKRRKPKTKRKNHTKKRKHKKRKSTRKK